MGPEPNLNNDLFDIICDKDLFVENEVLKLKVKQADRWSSRPDSLILNEIQTSSHNFKRYTKECLLQAFTLILPRVIC